MLYRSTVVDTITPLLPRAKFILQKNWNLQRSRTNLHLILSSMIPVVVRNLH